MNEYFNIEIVNPEKSFLSKDDVTEVVLPAFEGEMGILKDHISIISFLKPGIIKIFSKSEEEHYYVEDGIIEFNIDSKGYLLLQEIRDESHRFAINAQRKKKNAKNRKSQLDKIEGIGEVLKKRLLLNFKSLKNIKSAKIEDLMTVRGINAKIAQLIKEKL